MESVCRNELFDEIFPFFLTGFDHCFLAASAASNAYRLSFGSGLLLQDEHNKHVAESINIVIFIS